MNNYLLNNIEGAVVDLTTDMQKVTNLQNAHKFKSFLSLGAGAVLGVLGSSMLFQAGYDIGNLLVALPIGGCAIGVGGFLINHGINEYTVAKNCSAEKSGLMQKIDLLRDKINSESKNLDGNLVKPK